MKLRTNISDLGLLRSWIETRRRLWMTTGLTTVVSLACGLVSAWYILETSTSVVWNLLLITLNMMVLIVASYLQAVFVGDLSFPGPWREQVILGNHAVGSVSVKNHGAEFLIILVIAMMANIGVIELGSGGFFDRYHHEGFFEVRLRSSDPSERLAAFEDLRDPMNYQLWERSHIKTLILRHLTDPDPKTQASAIWIAGQLKLLEARAGLMQVAKDGTGDARDEALHALGKLGTNDEARLLLEEIALSPKGAPIAALRGLALMASPLSYETVLSLARSEVENTRIHALWVLRVIGDSKARPFIRGRLEVEVSQIEQCALLDTLKMVGTVEDVTWARLRFNEVAHDVVCAPLIWEERNERQHYVTYSDSMRVKYLKIVANADAKPQIEWLRRLVNDRDEEEHVREVANEVLKRLKAQ